MSPHPAPTPLPGAPGSRLWLLAVPAVAIGAVLLVLGLSTLTPAPSPLTLAVIDPTRGSIDCADLRERADDEEEVEIAAECGPGMFQGEEFEETLNVVIANDGDEPLEVTPADVVLIDREGRRYAGRGDEDDPATCELNPGEYCNRIIEFDNAGEPARLVLDHPAGELEVDAARFYDTSSYGEVLFDGEFE